MRVLGLAKLKAILYTIYTIWMTDYVGICPHPNLLKKLTSQRLRIGLNISFTVRGFAEFAGSLDMSLAKTNMHQNRRGHETVRAFSYMFFSFTTLSILRSMQTQPLHQDWFPRDLGFRAAHLAAGQWGLHCSSCRVRKKTAKFQVGKDPSQVVETVSIIYELSCLLSFTHRPYHISIFVKRSKFNSWPLLLFGQGNGLCQKSLALCAHMPSFRSYLIISIYFVFAKLFDNCRFMHTRVFFHQDHYSQPKNPLMSRPTLLFLWCLGSRTSSWRRNSGHGGFDLKIRGRSQTRAVWQSLFYWTWHYGT